MDKESRIIKDLEAEEVSGGAGSEAERLAKCYEVFGSLNGKTCKFCKKKFWKLEVISNYHDYSSGMLKRFESFNGKAVPCLYCDYWRKIEDFE